MSDELKLELLGNQIRSIVILIESIENKDSQEFLNLVDKLNEISVRF